VPSIVFSLAHSKEHRSTANRPYVLCVGSAKLDHSDVLFEYLWLCHPRPPPIDSVINVLTSVSDRKSFVRVNEDTSRTPSLQRSIVCATSFPPSRSSAIAVSSSAEAGGTVLRINELDAEQPKLLHRPTN
jgi:hypothetical protein